MQILYAFPFILLSLLAFLVCVIVRRFRRYAFHALAVPVIFGGCSIIGGIASALLSEFLLGRLNRFDTDTNKIIEIGIFISAYVLSGLCGAWAAVRSINWVNAQPLSANPE